MGSVLVVQVMNGAQCELFSEGDPYFFKLWSLVY